MKAKWFEHFDVPVLVASGDQSTLEDEVPSALLGEYELAFADAADKKTLIGQYEAVSDFWEEVGLLPIFAFFAPESGDDDHLLAKTVYGSYTSESPYPIVLINHDVFNAKSVKKRNLHEELRGTLLHELVHCFALTLPEDELVSVEEEEEIAEDFARRSSEYRIDPDRARGFLSRQLTSRFS